MIKYDAEDMKCNTCMGHGKCFDWRKEICPHKISPIVCLPIGRYYANKEQVEGLLADWNYRRGCQRGRYSSAPKEVVKKGRDFREEDKVYHLWRGNGVVGTIDKDLALPLGVKFEDGTWGWYSLEGMQSQGQVLYHGQDLEVTVKEQPPVRKVSRWIFVHIVFGTPETSAMYQTEAACYVAMGQPEREKFIVVKEPFEIKVEEKDIRE